MAHKGKSKPIKAIFLCTGKTCRKQYQTYLTINHLLEHIYMSNLIKATIYYMMKNDYLQKPNSCLFTGNYFWNLVEIQSAELGLNWDWPLKLLSRASEPTLLTYIYMFLFFNLSAKLKAWQRSFLRYTPSREETLAPPDFPPLLQLLIHQLFEMTHKDIFDSQRKKIWNC